MNLPRGAAAATRWTFLVAGPGMASWAPLVPFVKARAGLDAAALGLLLLCLGAGSLLAMPWAGAMARAWGCHRVIVVGAVLMGLALAALSVVASLPWLAVSLFVFGAAMGAVDCTMNLQAVIVERHAGRALMSGFHGLFSVGGLCGAGGMSGLLWLGLSPAAAVAVMLGVMAVALLLAVPGLLPGADQAHGPAFAVPRGVVLLIGLLCFIVFLTEGAVLDWSAVLLATVHGFGPAQAGLGYAAFSAAMTVGRLTGDAVVQRIGPVRALVVGAVVASAGLAVATLSASGIAALAGYLLVGAGCANIVPVLFSAAGRQTAMPASAAVPAITTVGYAGILAGPALIGFAAQGVGLAMAFVGVAAAMLAVAAGGLVLKARRIR